MKTKETVERFYVTVKSLFEFDQDRIHGVVQTLIPPTVHVVAVALDLAGNSYCETLKAVIREFQIGKADERVDAPSLSRRSFHLRMTKNRRSNCSRNF